MKTLFNKTAKTLLLLAAVAFVVLWVFILSGGLEMFNLNGPEVAGVLIYSSFGGVFILAVLHTIYTATKDERL